MIKNIVFDIGNVLISFKPKEYVDSFDFEPTIREVVFESIFKSEYWPRLDRGTTTEEEAVEFSCKAAPQADCEIRQVMAGWKDMLLPIPETIEILMELKAKGYKIFALSNYHKAAFERTFAENEFFKTLDGMVISYELGIIKPEREIYEHLLNKYALKPQETLFIDDMPENIQGAESTGINTFLFDNPIGLKNYFKKIGVL
jgi:putative hydrolase of the HAD superfamily